MYIITSDKDHCLAIYKQVCQVAHVSTVAQKEQTKHYLERGPFMVFM